MGVDISSVLFYGFEVTEELRDELEDRVTHHDIISMGNSYTGAMKHFFVLEIVRCDAPGEFVPVESLEIEEDEEWKEIVKKYCPDDKEPGWFLTKDLW